MKLIFQTYKNMNDYITLFYYEGISYLIRLDMYIDLLKFTTLYTVKLNGYKIKETNNLKEAIDCYNENSKARF
jgi:hypothetical protein